MKTMAALSLILTLQVSYAQHHDDHSQHNSTASVRHLDKNFKKLVPTEDLKVRMDKIQKLMVELKEIKTDQKVIPAYGTKVSDIVKDIFKTCKLEAKADDAFHPVLGKILQGSRDLQKGNYDVGFNKIHESLLEYGKLFSHEGWKH